MLSFQANFVQLLLVAEFVSSGIYAQKDEEQHCEAPQPFQANFVQLLLVAEFVSSGIYAQKDEEQHCEAPHLTSSLFCAIT